MPSMRSPSMGEGEVPCGEKQMSAVCVCTQTDTYLPMHPEGGMGIPEPTLNLQCGLPETRRSSVAMTESTTFLLGGKMQRPRLLHHFPGSIGWTQRNLPSPLPPARGGDAPHRDDGHVGDGTDTGTSRPWVLRSDPSGGQPEGVVLVPLEEGAIMSR